jgi:hypothetical protein
LGWLKDSQVECVLPGGEVVKQFDLSPIEDSISKIKKLLIIKLNAHAAVCVEFRCGLGGDSGILKPGLLVYFVDLSVVIGRVRVLPVNEDDGFKWNVTLGVDESVYFRGVSVRNVVSLGFADSLVDVSVVRVEVKWGSFKKGRKFFI